MIISIIILIVFLLLIFLKLFYPWKFLESPVYNILGKNKYGETKEQRRKRYSHEIDEIINKYNTTCHKEK